ncbi:MAG: nicotinamide riboside transporter PnuC [Coriobacteriales bacterium]|nr:nicotinamide riboside transporter PnuC [Coriobacteriales bacterium]
MKRALAQLKTFFIQEFTGFTKREILLYCLVLAIVIFISIWSQDTILGIANAITGIAFVLLNGKGKRLCYIFGFVNSIIYAIIALNAQLYGDGLLYIIYYMPVYIIGLFIWNKNIDKAKDFTVKKRKLSTKMRLVVLGIIIAGCAIFAIILTYMQDSQPILDSTTTFVSLVAMIIEVGRYCEQWPLWLIVNTAEVIMWSIALYNGIPNAASSIVMWLVFLGVSIVMWYKWNKDIS